MKWNTKIYIIQMIVVIIGLIQLLNNAIIMAMLSVFIVYIIGALENSGCDIDNNDA